MRVLTLHTCFEESPTSLRSASLAILNMPEVMHLSCVMFSFSRGSASQESCSTVRPLGALGLSVPPEEGVGAPVSRGRF